MSPNSELLDRAITYIVTFPVTMLGVLVAPRKVLSNEFADKRCPPSVAIALGISVWFVGNRTILRIMAGESTIPLVPTGYEIGRLIVATAVILLIQAFILSALLRKRRPNRDWRITAQYLAYPIGCAFLGVGLVKLLSVHFPDATRAASEIIAQMECHSDSAIREVYGGCADYVEAVTATFPMQVRQIAFMSGVVIYVWALYNVVRAYLGVSWFRSVGITVVAVASLMAVLVLGLLTVERTEKQVKMRLEEGARTKPIPPAESRIENDNDRSKSP